MYDEENEIVRRIREQDRSAAAHFFERNRDRIQRAVSGRVPDGMRPVMDTEVLMATMVRRFDSDVARGSISPCCINDVWRHIEDLANEACIDIEAVRETLPHHDAGELSADLQVFFESSGEFELNELLDRLEPEERQMMVLILKGNSMKYAVAPLMRLNYESARKMLQVIREELRDYVHSKRQYAERGDRSRD